MFLHSLLSISKDGLSKIRKILERHTHGQEKEQLSSEAKEQKEQMKEGWTTLIRECEQIVKNIGGTPNGSKEESSVGFSLKFEFREGLLVEAMRKGDWIILDELNLAPADLLQRIQGLFSDRTGHAGTSDQGGELVLPECGDLTIRPHKDFRIFACMNPPCLPPDTGKFGQKKSIGSNTDALDVTGSAVHLEGNSLKKMKLDAAATNSTGTLKEPSNTEDLQQLAGAKHAVQAAAGKKELPAGIRSRFTEIFVDECFSETDLDLIVRGYLEKVMKCPPSSQIVDFYQQCRAKACAGYLLDGADKVVHFL